MSKTDIAGRRQAREYVFKLVFEYTFCHEINERTYAMFCAALSEEERPYLESTVAGVIGHFDEMVGVIMSKVKGYSSPDRLNRTDLALMVYAAYELLYRRDEVPAAVVIAEAVELAKEYGGEKSGRFVNGVLGAVERDKK